MGADIHLYVEKRNKLGQWEVLKGRNPQIDNLLFYADNARKNGDLERAELLEKNSKDIASGARQQEEIAKYPDDGDYDYYAPEVYVDWLYDGRNYNLFSILADVRNGYGFAGVPTGEGFVPIAQPKGLPQDVSGYVRERSSGWGEDGHSHSYLTVRELQEYDWDQETVHYGVVGKEEYQVWKQEGMPSSWSGGVSGRGVVHISNEEMDALIRGEYLEDTEKSYYTRVSWRSSYYESAGDFHRSSLPRLEELVEENPDDVRIVFWFDN